VRAVSVRFHLMTNRLGKQPSNVLSFGEGASVGMLSVDCINFNSVGVQEPKLHETDEMGYLDEG
jgi:hypothetical protein